jgi:hypothetical protein
MAQANSGKSWSYTQAEIDNHVGKMASLRALIGSWRYLHLSPRWCDGKLVFVFPVEQAQVFHLDFPLG